MNYRIEKADSKSKYEGLRDLWCRVFGDRPEFVDEFYRAFGSDIQGYVIYSDEGRVISELTCFAAGRMYMPHPAAMQMPDAAGTCMPHAAVMQMPHEDGKPAHQPGRTCLPLKGSAGGLPVYVSYAICTDPAFRGLGLAALLTEYVRRLVTEEYGGISLVSPAEPSLIGYYAAHGYREGFYVTEETIGLSTVCEEDPSVSVHKDECDPDPDGTGSSSADRYTWGIGSDGLPGFIDEENDSFAGFKPELHVESVGINEYNKFREEFLADIPHVSLSREMLEFARADSEGGDGLLVLNGGDAICRLAYSSAGSPAAETEGHTVVVDDLIVSPVLKELSEEIAEEIALQLAEHFGAETIVCRTPGFGRCQSMYAAACDVEIEGYFGFPVD